MEKIVFACSDVKELKKVLEADTLSDDSFARLGYVLREGKPYGIEGYVVYFKAPQDKAAAYKAKLSAILGCKEVSGDPKTKVVQAVETEEDSAAAGFGSVFG